MEFVIESVKFKPFHPEWERFRQDKNQVIGQDLYRRGVRLQMMAKGSVPKRTGELAASIYVEYYRGVRDPHVVIGSRLKHAYYVHEGTKPHLIYPNFGRVLRFVDRGKVVYTRKPAHHPGTRATYYLSKHLPAVVR